MTAYLCPKCRQEGHAVTCEQGKEWSRELSYRVSRLDRLNRDRAALTDVFVRLVNPSPAEYNALVHAIWRLDRDIREVSE